MACCGGAARGGSPIVNEQREGFVLARPLWAGLRNYWGVASGLLYGRVSNATLLWVHPSDLADPLLVRVEPTEATAPEATEPEREPSDAAGPEASPPDEGAHSGTRRRGR